MMVEVNLPKPFMQSLSQKDAKITYTQVVGICRCWHTSPKIENQEKFQHIFSKKHPNFSHFLIFKISQNSFFKYAKIIEIVKSIEFGGFSKKIPVISLKCQS